MTATSKGSRVGASRRIFGARANDVKCDKFLFGSGLLKIKGNRICLKMKSEEQDTRS